MARVVSRGLLPEIGLLKAMPNTGEPSQLGEQHVRGCAQGRSWWRLWGAVAAAAAAAATIAG